MELKKLEKALEKNGWELVALAPYEDGFITVCKREFAIMEGLNYLSSHYSDETGFYWSWYDLNLEQAMERFKGRILK